MSATAWLALMGIAAAQNDAGKVASPPPAASPSAEQSPSPGVTADDVLTWKADRFHLDGKPFAEISFNKFDLLWAVCRGIDEAHRKGDPGLEKAAVESQEAALRELHDMGFRTIRIFATAEISPGAAWDDPQKQSLWLKSVDRVLDLCDRYQMKLVFSLGAAAMHDPLSRKNQPAAPDREGLLHLVGNAGSRSRGRLYNYLDEIIPRYRGRKAIAMWEITNELTNSADIGQWKGEKMPTLAQVAAFYEDVARRIKRHDPVRLISNGGSHLREFAWNLSQGNGWKRDTPEEHQRAYELLFKSSSVDVIDTHYYAIRDGGFKLAAGGDGRPVVCDLRAYLAFAKKLGKISIIGEYGPLPSGWEGERKADADWFTGYNEPNAVRWIGKAVDDAVAAGVPLLYFWCYQSDRRQDQKDYPIYLDQQRTPELVRIIADGNRRLREKLGTR